MTGAIVPLASTFGAAYLDGVHPVRQAAVVTLEQQAIRIWIDGLETGSWAYEELNVACDGSYGEPVRLERRSGAPGESVVIEHGDFLTALEQHTTVFRDKPPLAGINGWPAVLLCSAMLTAFGSALYFWGLGIMANAITAAMPQSMEERLGQAVTNIYAPAGMRCSDAQRDPLLARISDRLSRAAGPGQTFRITYTSHPIANAFAAPGGYIVVFQGLLDQTRTPEEYAAVLGHEMMHVVKRHSMRALVRHVSTQTLLRLLAMDSAGTPGGLENAVALGNLRYQRDDEEEADVESVKLLVDAQVEPGGLVSFFRRLHSNLPISDSPFSYFSSHPALLDRARRIEEEIRNMQRSSTPLLTPEEWAIARRACNSLPIPR